MIVLCGVFRDPFWFKGHRAAKRRRPQVFVCIVFGIGYASQCLQAARHTAYEQGCGDVDWGLS
jgi:hypothetical protein